MSRDVEVSTDDEYHLRSALNWRRWVVLLWMLPLIAIGAVYLAAYTADVISRDIREQLDRHAEDITKQLEECRGDLASDLATIEQSLEKTTSDLSSQLVDLRQSVEALENKVAVSRHVASNFDPDPPDPFR